MTMTITQPPAAGFAEPVRDAQLTFRAVLDALSLPTRAVEIPTTSEIARIGGTDCGGFYSRPAALSSSASPPVRLSSSALPDTSRTHPRYDPAYPRDLLDAPAPLSGAAAAIVLTLCDDATSIWLDEPLRNAQVTSWIAFHTGARFVDQAHDAAFALIAEPARMPDLTVFEQGSDEAPHTSTTIVVIDAEGCEGGQGGILYTADGPGFEHSLSWMSPALPETFGSQWATNHALFPRGVDLLVATTHTVTGLPRTTRLTRVSEASEISEVFADAAAADDASIIETFTDAKGSL